MSPVPLLTALAVAVAATLAAGQPPSHTGQVLPLHTGQELLHDCTEALSVIDTGRAGDRLAAGWCMGYLEGIGQSYFHVLLRTGARPGGLPFCLPRDASSLQLMRVIVHHLRTTPPPPQQSGWRALLTALETAFPYSDARPPPSPTPRKSR